MSYKNNDDDSVYVGPCLNDMIEIPDLRDTTFDFSNASENCSVKTGRVNVSLSRSQTGTLKALSDYDCLNFLDTPQANSTGNLGGHYRKRRYNLNTVYTTDNFEDELLYTIGFKNKFRGLTFDNYLNVDTEKLRTNCSVPDSNGYMVSYHKVSKFFIPFCDKVNLTKCKFRILLGDVVVSDNNRHGNSLLYDLFIGVIDPLGRWDNLIPFVKDTKTLTDGQENTPFNRG